MQLNMELYMDWLEPYYDELQLVFDQVNLGTEQFPSSLRQHGLDYIRLFHPLEPNSTKNYICYLLPYWLQPWSGISLSECRRLAIANVWVMLHYFLLDDAMDEQPADWKARLALADLCSLAYMEEYRRLFDYDSPFWTAMKRYTATWSEAVTQEDKDDFFAHTPQRIAWKAAPVKLAAAGAYLLGHREDQLVRAEQAIDVVLVTLQMCDDWVDWREDLASGNYNSLLSFLRQKLQTSADQPLTEAQYESALYDRQLHKDFAEIVCAQQRRLQELQPPSSTLIAFHEYLVQDLLTSSSQLTQETRLLTQGGFYYWLSNSRQL